jgi:hypothetical protein
VELLPKGHEDGDGNSTHLPNSCSIKTSCLQIVTCKIGEPGINGFSALLPTHPGCGCRLENKISPRYWTWIPLALQSGLGGFTRLSDPNISAPQNFCRASQVMRRAKSFGAVSHFRSFQKFQGCS